MLAGKHPRVAAAQTLAAADGSPMTSRFPLLNNLTDTTAPPPLDSTRPLPLAGLRGRSGTLKHPAVPTNTNRGMALAPTRAVAGKPVWIAVEPEPIYAVLHMPEALSPGRVGVLILPTFGWDSDCSYRARRDWATQLAESGVPSARIDLPGTENSVGSPLAHNRLQSWIDATSAAASWLREASSCERVAAIGIGLGGLLAYQSAARDGPIDDLILWATRATGRAYLRELRAYATVASGETGAEPDAPRSDGAIGIAGHLMGKESIGALNALRIAGVPLPRADRRRVLLIGRDGHGVDNQLEEHMAKTGAQLTLLDGQDYHRLMALPELRLTPTATISASIDWLLDPAAKELETTALTAVEPAPASSDQIEFTYDGTVIRERICEFETTSGRLVGILSEPTGSAQPPNAMAPYCLVAVNSGELRHTGPNRLLVEVARRAAINGVPAVRFDLPGLGDSEGDSVRTFERTFEDDALTLAVINEIYDQLEQLQVAARFVPAGLCLGAYFAIRAVLENRRSVGAIAINPPAFRWTSVQLNTLRRGLAAVAPEVLTARRDEPALAPVTGRVERGYRRVEHASRLLALYARRRLAHWSVLWRFARRAATADALRMLGRLASTSTPILLLLAEDESVRRLLEQPKLAAKLASCPNVSVGQLPTRDHILRPLSSQEAAIESISAALKAGMWSSGQQRQTEPGVGPLK